MTAQIIPLTTRATPLVSSATNANQAAISSSDAGYPASGDQIAELNEVLHTGDYIRKNNLESQSKGSVVSLGWKYNPKYHF